MQIMSASRYKDIVRLKIKENAETRAYKSQLAKAAGCQNSYLSLVLKGDAHFTPDQAAALCKFWQLTDLETEYVLTLVSLDRAGTPHLRKILQARLERLRQEAQKLSVRLEGPGKEPKLELEQSMRYYSKWYWSCIHVSLRIPELRTSEALSRRFNIPVSLVQSVLEGLVDMKLAVRVEDEWHTSPDDIYLYRNIPILAMHQESLHQRARLALLSISEADPDHNSQNRLHYSSLHSVAKKDIPRLREIFIEAITKSREVMRPSADEELIGLCCDLFVC